MRIEKNMFREYDIRGLVGEELNAETSEAIGKAFGTFLQKKLKGKKISVVVGSDNRTSSEELKQGFISGLTSVGCNVIDIGLSSTPQLYFATYFLKTDAGANVTGSHNPKDFNGFKLTFEKALPFFGKQIQELFEIIKNEKFFQAEEKGKIEEKNVFDEYLETIKQKININKIKNNKNSPNLNFKSLKVVVDAGNGMASELAPKLFSELGFNVIPLFCTLDGSFPNHLPDPSKPEFLQELIETVKREKADVGIAFDGDCDRVGVVDSNGQIIWGDYLMILFVREILSKHKGAKILFEVKCSQALYEEILKLKGKPIIWKTGHSLIKDKMRKEKALLAGEMSGHMFFADEYFGFDDALYAAARLLRILSSSNQKISEMLASVPKYFATPELRLNCPDEKKFEVVEECKKFFKKEFPASVTVDGIRIAFPKGWALIRASNTQPKLIVRMEAKSKDELLKIKEMVLEKLREFPEVDLAELKCVKA